MDVLIRKPPSSSDHSPKDSIAHVPGRSHRARSADPLMRSRTRSSDRLSTSTTTTSTRSASRTSIHRDWHPDRTTHSCPEPLSASQCHLHNHRCNDNDDDDDHLKNGRGQDSGPFLNKRLYHSDLSIHRHHHHQEHHHHHNHERDEDGPRRRRRRREKRDHHSHHQPDHHPHSSSRSLPCSGSASRTCSHPRRGSSEPRDSSLNLSLCGCGFLGVYHLGVVTCLLKYGPSFLSKVHRVAGTSGGALAAAVLVTAPTLRQVQASAELVSAMARKVRRKPLGALTPGFRLAKEIEKLLDRVLPPDAHVLARDRLHVSLTDVTTNNNVVVSEFQSREELIQTLVASCHMPVYSGLKFPSVCGKPYCDGGLSNNLLQFSEGRTVTVSPFSGRQDIGPRDPLHKGSKGWFFNLGNHDMQASWNNVRRVSHAFFPPSGALLQHYFELGHKDASRFLVKEGLYEIPWPPEKPPIMRESSV